MAPRPVTPTSIFGEDSFEFTGTFSRFKDPLGHGDLYKGFKGLEREILKAQVRAMRRGALLMARAARSTGAYQDDTGATRASTYAFVQNFTKADVPGDAEDIAEAINPGHGVSTIRAIYGSEEFFFGEAGDPVIILSTGTDYTQFLETAAGGRNAFLGPSMDSVAPTVQQLLATYCQSAITRYDVKTALASNGGSGTA